MAVATPPAYPVRLEVAHPEGENRFAILVRWLLALPHYVVLYFLGIVLGVLLVVAWFVILFTGRFPEGLFRFAVGVLRWQYAVWTYVLFHNRYPPFSFEDGDYPPLTYQVQRQERYSRLLIFVKWLLVLPHAVVLAFLQLAGFFVYLFVLVAVLVTGRYPRGAFDFLVGVGRWNARMTAYVYLLTDRYPPFSLR